MYSNTDFIPITCSWKTEFVRNSNMIDPQPGYDGRKPGCQMFENHMNALNFVLSDGWEINVNTPLDIHRILTKNIDFFENSNNSGKYRIQDVWIGSEIAPSSYLIHKLMHEQWFPSVNTLTNLVYDNKMSAIESAWIIHHMFQVIHPFIDGNGRTGRLLFTKILKDLGEDPHIIHYLDRHEYYDCIQYFRDKNWDQNKFILEGLWKS